MTVRTCPNVTHSISLRFKEENFSLSVFILLKIILINKYGKIFLLVFLSGNITKISEFFLNLMGRLHTSKKEI